MKKMRGFVTLAITVALGAGSLLSASSAEGQQAASGSALSAAIGSLSEMMPQLAGSTDELRLQKWKLHGDDRDAVERDVASVRRDVDVVLPPLVQQAQAAPGSVAKGLAVYRNVNALYDVMLRTTITAQYSGNRDDLAVLGQALDKLEAVRKQLGQALLDTAATQEATLAKLQQATVVQPSAANAGPKHIVVDDGPVKKKAPAKKPAAKKPAAGTPAGGTGSGTTAPAQ
jgi:hypothetical protein